jgi:hypothetical protein
VYKYDVMINDNSGGQPLVDTEVHASNIGDAMRQAITLADMDQIDEGHWRMEVSLSE